jgi:LmbE family N-acetylglucosaminyl deacetylase
LISSGNNIFSISLSQSSQIDYGKLYSLFYYPKDVNLSDFLNALELSEIHEKILLESRRILSIEPHPDDNEIVAGGFISQKIEEGASFKLVVVSDGKKGSRSLGEEELIIIRKKEQESALNILGAKDVEYLNHIDSEVPLPSVLREDIIKVIREFAPDLVITVDPFLPYEVHPDHINTGLAVLQAVLFADFPNIGKGKPVNRPSVALGFTYTPNVIYNCSRTFETKLAAIKAHRSQFTDDSFIKLIGTISAIYGKRIGCNYGEAFRVLLPNELHVNVLAGMNLA